MNKLKILPCLFPCFLFFGCHKFSSHYRIQNQTDSPKVVRWVPSEADIVWELEVPAYSTVTGLRPHGELPDFRQWEGGDAKFVILDSEKKKLLEKKYVDFEGVNQDSSLAGNFGRWYPELNASIFFLITEEDFIYVLHSKKGVIIENDGEFK